jgi:hypothetical protein
VHATKAYRVSFFNPGVRVLVHTEQKVGRAVEMREINHNYIHCEIPEMPYKI